MAKKKPLDDTDDTAAVDTTEPEPVLGTSQHALESDTYEMVRDDGPHGDMAVCAKTGPGPKSYYLMVGGLRYVHVGDTPDGRWVYRPDY